MTGDQRNALRAARDHAARATILHPTKTTYVGPDTPEHCDWCQGPLPPTRAVNRDRKRFCSDNHRSHWHRRNRRIRERSSV